MSVHKSFHCLSGRCTNLMRCFGNISRSYSVMKGDKHKFPSRCMPREISVQNVLLPRCSFVQAYSQSPTAEPVSTPSITSNQSMKFEDVSFDAPVPHEDLIKALQNCKSVVEQMETLVTIVGLSPEDIQRRVNFCKVLESLFEPFFIDFRIQMFGSTVNCFGFKGCDIDMTFETSRKVKEVTNDLEIPDIPLISEVLSGKVSPEELSEMPCKEQLVFMHTVFLEYYKESKDPAIFINAFVPLVRFHHDKYNLKCDLTFKNRVAYANTKLLYLFAKLDERVVPLMMTIRYWAKHVELIGKGLLFNTYTITLLVIHFLQTRSPAILPSAEYIMSLSNSFEVDDMNDKSFLDIKDKIPPSENTQTIDELLKEFFFYYLFFDFTRVICPLISSSVSREEFFSGDKNRKFRMNSICVQDPMCVAHNVAEFVDYKHCRKLFFELMVVCKMFQDNNLFTPSNGVWGLMAILDKPEEYHLNNIYGQNLVSLTVPLISRNMEGKSLPDQERAQFSAETILNILKHALLFQCYPLELSKIHDLLKRQDELVTKEKKSLETLESGQVPHRRKKSSKPFSLYTKCDISEESMLEQFQKFSSERELVLCAQCIASKNTWQGREFVNLDTTTCTAMNILDKEHLISVATAAQNKINIADKEIKSFMFLFECYTSARNPETVIVNFRSLQRMSFNPILGIFLKEYIPKIVRNVDNNT